ncbi:hypothetical protein H2201_004001 [Coniosporium apollinis]|uniref:Uncharacterized protein n=2 Tax=Coniosporium TaxID=2810619 RepID=A0ABQ9NUT2_9PEZI|nr:hypothetical protein H2199_005500 [Cladosporium sp. JES 115]KAJ9665877.1 hypothetical protein H2201_004001 [Coniosporium apollinis]
MTNAVPAIIKAISPDSEDNGADDADNTDVSDELSAEESNLKHLCEHVETLPVGKIQAEQRERVAIQHLRVLIENQRKLCEANGDLRNIIGLWEQPFKAACLCL